MSTTTLVDNYPSKMQILHGIHLKSATSIAISRAHLPISAWIIKRLVTISNNYKSDDEPPLPAPSRSTV